MNEKAVTKMNTRKWHYKFLHLVLGQLAPTPQNMHNLCPYFWLLVFSIIVSPVVLPIKAIVLVVKTIDDAVVDFTMNYMTLPAATSWAENLSDLDAYQIYQHNKNIKKSYKKAFGRGYDSYIDSYDFIIDWWARRYNKKAITKGTNRFNSTYTKDFDTWREEQHKLYDELIDKQSEKEHQKRLKTYRYEEKMENFRDGFDELIEKVRNYFSSWKNIIKWTKRFVGLIITIAGLVATYFIVNFLGRGILWLVEHWDWQVVLGIVLLCAAIGVVVLIVYLMRAWINYMSDKGTELWYVKGAYYLALAIFWPFKFIFYMFIWQFLLVNIWFFIVKSAKLVWGTLLGFFGIFGEYFGASYTDYCPGIEWEENEEDNI